MARLRKKHLGNVGLALLALTTAGVVAFAWVNPDSGATARDQAAAYNSQNSKLPTQKAFHQTTWEEAKPQMLDGSKPFTVAVIGDSTGNEPGEWVDLSMRALAAKTGRPLIMHTWDLATNAYAAPVTLAQGAGQPLTVWNGSASGKSGIYAKEYFGKLFPEVTDLAIINHGHNITVAAAATEQIDGLIKSVRMKSNGKTAIALTLQNPEVGVNRERNEQVVSLIHGLAVADKSLLEVDVHAAFVGRDDLAKDLRPDGLHPSESGSELWAEAVRTSLGF